MELERRLGLYQVFLKLYEHHRSLLDEILQLENSASRSLNGTAPAYIQGAVQGQKAYLIANLRQGKTQRFLQPQGIWLLGRDRRLALSVQDRWMSRRHAAIQYIKNKGFYLVDLNSTNGSFINGEPVLQRQLLQDGDRIRLGSVTISFFVCQSDQLLEPVPKELLAQINVASDFPGHVEKPTPDLTEKKENLKLLKDRDRDFSPSVKSQDVTPLLPLEATVSKAIESIETNDISSEDPEDTSLLPKQKLSLEKPTAAAFSLPLTTSEQSEILDRFFNRKLPVDRN